MTWIHNMNEKVADSRIGRYFLIKERNSTFSTELRAGMVTFLTTCYILAVNSGILSDTGGTCTYMDCKNPTPGCMFANPPDEGWMQCIREVRSSLVAATAGTALMACFLMGVFANLPLAVAPGMGINAYFTYTVVGFYGTGKITYQQALAAVFVEGWIFLAISISGVRGKIISSVPKCIMLATAGGIGLFLAFIGLQKSEGIGMVTYDSATLVTLGGCPPANRIHQYSIADSSVGAVCKIPDPAKCMTDPIGCVNMDLGPPSSNYGCKGKRLHSANFWMGVAGFAIMTLLMARRVKGSIMLGIVFVTVVSWIPGHGGSYLGPTSEIPGGPGRLEDFKHVVSVPDASKTTLAWSWDAFHNPDLWVALITFLYLDFLDATGTLFSMASMLNQRMPGFIDERTKSFPRQVFAFCVDGVAIILGSLFGCAPLTVYIESASGIREGGRTGITALVVAFGFFVSLFFTPLIVSIPPYATGPALILVGAMMMENLVDIDWSDVRQAIPSFLAIVTMPLTYSIAYGVIAGIGAYLFLWLSLFGIDVAIMPFSKRSFPDVWAEHCPDLFSHRLTKPNPLKSPSAVLQEHVNPEHAAHAEAAAKASKYDPPQRVADDAKDVDQPVRDQV